MANFAPRSTTAFHHFEIAEGKRGLWVVKDLEGLTGGVFVTQKDALRFALFEVDGSSSYVQVLSADVVAGARPPGQGSS